MAGSVRPFLLRRQGLCHQPGNASASFYQKTAVLTAKKAEAGNHASRFLCFFSDLVLREALFQSRQEDRAIPECADNDKCRVHLEFLKQQKACRSDQDELKRAACFI